MEETLTMGSPIQQFVKSTKDQILAGLGDLELKTPIEMELNVTVSGKAGAGLDINVIEFGAKVEATQVQKVRFSIGQKSEVEEAEKAARIAKAIADKKDEEARAKEEKGVWIA